MESPIVAFYKDKESHYIACRDAQGVFTVYKKVEDDENMGFIYHDKDLGIPIKFIRVGADDVEMFRIR